MVILEIQHLPAKRVKFNKHILSSFIKIRSWVIFLLNSLDEIALPPIEKGCASNNDCPDYTACVNRKCINPCAADNVCAPNAICTVTRHKPFCACPDGYIGSPEVTCTLRK